jgi:hypothetical protein
MNKFNEFNEWQSITDADFPFFDPIAEENAYDDLEFELKYNELIDKQNESEIFKLCLKHKQPFTMLKKYFPHLF